MSEVEKCLECLDADGPILLESGENVCMGCLVKRYEASEEHREVIAAVRAEEQERIIGIIQARIDTGCDCSACREDRRILGAIRRGEGT